MALKILLEMINTIAWDLLNPGMHEVYENSECLSKE
jgi:hypothetical protein